MKTFSQFLIEFWKLLKGAIHYRFATFLVRMGVLLVTVTPFTLIVNTISDIFYAQTNKPIPDEFNWSIFIGIFLILAGIFTYYYGEAKKSSQESGSPPIPDQTDFTILEGWTFESVARAIVKQSEFVIVFEGFSDEDLKSKMRAQELKAKNDIEALKLIRHCVQSSDFPDYVVLEADGRLFLRAKDGK